MSLFSKVFLLTQIGLQALVAFLNPNTEGFPILMPSNFAFYWGHSVFIFQKKDDPLLLRGLYIFSIVSFAFLALDYTINGHIGIIQLAITFVPLFLLWLVYFVKWNYRHLKSKDSLGALGLASVSAGLLCSSFSATPSRCRRSYFLSALVYCITKEKTFCSPFCHFLVWGNIQCD